MDDLRPANLPPAEDLVLARQSPIALLCGLLVGIIFAYVAGVFVWIAAPVFPLMLWLCTVGFMRTRAFSVGALAAACGVGAFLISLGVLFLL